MKWFQEEVCDLGLPQFDLDQYETLFKTLLIPVDDPKKIIDVTVIFSQAVSMSKYWNTVSTQVLKWHPQTIMCICFNGM